MGSLSRRSRFEHLLQFVQRHLSFLKALSEDLHEDYGKTVLQL
jgi:hypothetical protein